MTPEDRQKIHAMKDHGMSFADICYRYRHRYKSNEVRDAFKLESKIEDEELRKAVADRKAKRPRRRRRTKAEMEAARNVGSIDM